MAYATQDDIVALYGEDALHNVAPLTEADEPDPIKVAVALDRASAEIDAYLSGRYAVPLADPGMQIKQLAVDIAMYRMPISLGIQTSEHRLRYEDAIKFLQLAAAGKAGIGIGVDDADADAPGTEFRATRTAFLFRA